MRAIDAGLMICHDCHQLNPIQAANGKQFCTRCGAKLHARRPNSLARTWGATTDSSRAVYPR